jgi:S-adenosylmethionine:tRNA ribosyltransferase-isomerase
MRLRVDDFDYELPPEAIAQVPAEPRDASRLLVLDRRASTPGQPALTEASFSEIGRWIRPGDILVPNDSRVLAARLRARRAGGGAAEILLLRPRDDGSWEALVRPSARIRPGATVTVGGDATVEVGERLPGDTRAVRFATSAEELMARAGEMPLPPYIRDRSAPMDRYQTVYAEPPGSAAAPTAGLHFTPELIANLRHIGVTWAPVTLHVGLDTFRPLTGTFVDEHAIHHEWYAIPESTRVAITARPAGARVIAVGTTSVRVLESEAATGQATGWADLYIIPPHEFAAVDALITNFHLPRSSLLLLVTAFVQAGMAGATALEARDTLLAAYRQALGSGFRFFSFGDAMLIR